MWFRLTHTRYSRRSFGKQKSDESKVHERDEIFFFLYVCRLSITIATMISFSFLHTFSERLCWCVLLFRSIFEIAYSAWYQKHRLPQHQHWAWKHRRFGLTVLEVFENPKKCFAQKFRATSVVRSSLCWCLSFWDCDGFLLMKNWF